MKTVRPFRIGKTILHPLITELAGFLKPRSVLSTETGFTSNDPCREGRDWRIGREGVRAQKHQCITDVGQTLDRQHARGLVNGEVRQDSNTRHLVFNVFDQIAHLSEAMTLEPGDLIYTGTPGGVGAAMKPMRFLKAGDLVRVEIEGLGAIENPCADEA